MRLGGLREGHQRSYVPLSLPLLLARTPFADSPPFFFVRLPAIFKSKQKIMRHLQSHTGHKPFVCDICKQTFSEAATLQQHVRRHSKDSACCPLPLLDS